MTVYVEYCDAKLTQLEEQRKFNPYHKLAGSPNGTGGQFDFAPSNGGSRHRGGGQSVGRGRYRVDVPDDRSLERVSDSNPDKNPESYSDSSLSHKPRDVAQRLRRPNPEPMLPKPPKTLRASPEAVEAIMGKEGFLSQPYRVLDNNGKPSGNWTIGYGHEIRKGESFPEEGITPAQAEAILNQDIRDAENAVRYQVNVPLTQPQFDALTSFTYNYGYGNFGKSKLRRRLNEGDYEGAADAFLDYGFSRDSNGKPEIKPGSPMRRLEESELFRRGTVQKNKR